MKWSFKGDNLVLLREGCPDCREYIMFQPAINCRPNVAPAIFSLKLNCRVGLYISNPDYNPDKGEKPDIWVVRYDPSSDRWFKMRAAKEKDLQELQTTRGVL